MGYNLRSSPEQLVRLRYFEATKFNQFPNWLYTRTVPRVPDVQPGPIHLICRKPDIATPNGTHIDNVFDGRCCCEVGLVSLHNILNYSWDIHELRNETFQREGTSDNSEVKRNHFWVLQKWKQPNSGTSGCAFRLHKRILERSNFAGSHVRNSRHG